MTTATSDRVDPPIEQTVPVMSDLADNDLQRSALALLRESAAMKRARETVRAYAEQARAQLLPLPGVPARSALESLCDFIADRTG